MDKLEFGIPEKRLKDSPFAANDYNTIGRTSDGECYLWGIFECCGIQHPKRLYLRIEGSEWKNFFSRSDITIVITSLGNCFVWGGNKHGQLGIGHRGYCGDTPQKLATPSDSKWKNFDFGHKRVIGTTCDGNVYTWGLNMENVSLGTKGRVYQTSPKLLSPPPNETWKSFDCGWYHTYAISSSGDVYAWGLNKDGQLGYGNCYKRATPYKFPSPPNKSTWKYFACGLDFSIGMTHAGNAYAWGKNENGQLGLDDTEFRSVPHLLPHPDNETWKDFVCGRDYTFGMTTSGKVYAWGNNTNGQLGLGDQLERHTPHLLPPPTEYSSWRNFCCLNDCVYGFATCDRVYSWGRGEHNQLGLGNQTSHYTPQFLRSPSKLFNWETSGRDLVKKPEKFNITNVLDNERHTDMCIGNRRCHSVLISLRCPSLLRFSKEPLPFSDTSFDALLNMIYGCDKLIKQLSTRDLLELFKFIRDDDVAYRDFRHIVTGTLFWKKMNTKEKFIEMFRLAEEMKLEHIMFLAIEHYKKLIADDFNREDVFQVLSEIGSKHFERELLMILLRRPAKKRRVTPGEKERSLFDFLKMLFTTHQGSDFTIIVDEEEFPVHRFVLSTRNEYFRAMLEDHTLESKTGKVDMSQSPLSPSSMRKVLEFIYCGETDQKQITEEESQEIVTSSLLEFVI